MVETMAVKKSPFKSKTNLAQMPLGVLVLSSLLVPEVRQLLCQDGPVIIVIQLIVTLVARNYKSNISLKKG